MTVRRPARLPAALAILMLVAIAVPGVVLGHAALVTVTPADKSTVVGAPAEIVMTFTENLDPGKSSIRVVDAGGAVVAEGGRVDPGDDVNTMRLAILTGLAPGTYTIRWTSFSTEDNEQDRGTTTFTVTAPSAPPSIAPSKPPVDTPSASPSAASVAPSAAPSPSSPPTSPTASTSDVLIPIIVVVIAILGLGVGLARSRSRRNA